MSSIMMQMAGRKQQPLSPEQLLSLEAAVQYASEASDEQMADLEELARGVNTNIVQIDDSNNLLSGLNNLITETLGEYSPSKYSEENFELFKASLESILISAGIPINSDRIYPSFEDAGIVTPGTVVAPAQGIMARIKIWLAELLEQLRNGMMLFVARLRNNKAAFKTYLDEVNNKMDRMSKSEPAADQVNTGRAADYLLDRNGNIGLPANVITSNVALYEDFINDWESLWSRLIAVRIPTELSKKAAGEEFKKDVTDLSTRLGENKYNHDLQFIISGHLEITPGRGEDPVMSASVKILPGRKARSPMADTLSKKEMRVGLDTAYAALKVVDTMDRKINDIVNQVNRVKIASKNVKVANDGSEADVRDALKVIGKACSMATYGYLNTGPEFLKALKSGVRYVELSANQYL